ncbi:hypothetical protein QU487_02755 [Crenobacter sp. SG2305]|uniref:hypothetical protein n=1 Tax=Crenobacter oryzisoli TaxID=3056844 RepID=UPI0025AA6DD6|nr:hypothetical protein [Crenobacter sp. SG2305]MDN0081682.1 hypothetical protein [Crenobacter sp. SG2305]
MSTLADQLEEMFLSDKVTCLSPKFAATLTGQDVELCSAALAELVARGVLFSNASKSSNEEGQVSHQTTYFLRED